MRPALQAIRIKRKREQIGEYDQSRATRKTYFVDECMLVESDIVISYYF